MEKDLRRAIELYNQAAESGDAWAIAQVGMCYGNGEGVEKNMDMAVRYFKRGFALGDSCSTGNLGLCHVHGNSVCKDTRTGVRLLRLAVDTGFMEAKATLEAMCPHGR